jgi:hypothetical protein
MILRIVFFRDYGFSRTGVDDLQSCVPYQLVTSVGRVIEIIGNNARNKKLGDNLELKLLPLPSLSCSDNRLDLIVILVKK